MLHWRGFLSAKRFIHSSCYRVELMRTTLRIITPLLLLAALFTLLAWRPAVADEEECTELLFNGDMENVNGWSFPSNRGEYSTAQFLSPTHSAHLGEVAGGQVTFSSMRQDVTVPAGQQLLLSWHVYPQSEPFDAADRMLASILDPVTSAEQRRVWSDVRDDRAWVACSYDVSEFLDQEIKVNFTVRNDAHNGFSEMFVDDVSLKVCSVPQATLEGCLLATPSPTPTVTPTETTAPSPTPSPTHTATTTPSPTATPSATATATDTPTATATTTPSIPDTATPTATPSATVTPTATPPSTCRQIVANPDFDRGTFGYDDWTNNLLLTTAFEDVDGVRHRGAWLGGATASNHFLYQDVSVPAGAPAPHLSYWWALNPGLDDPVLSAGDALTATLRSPADNSILQQLQVIGQGSSRLRWQLQETDLGGYAGSEIRLYFEATTDQAIASWYLDQIKINTCALDRVLYTPMILRPQ